MNTLFSEVQISDKVIASRKQNNKRRTGRRSSAKPSAKAALVGSSGTATAKAVKKTKIVETKAASNAPPKAEKIIVSNLPPDVNEAQIKVSSSLILGFFSRPDFKIGIVP